MDEHLMHRFLTSSPNKHSASKATQKKCQLYEKKKKADIHLDIQENLEYLKWTMLSSQQNKIDCDPEWHATVLDMMLLLISVRILLFR